LASLTAADLSDQIGAPNIGIRVDQVLQHIRWDSSHFEIMRALPVAFAASRSWTHWHALTWFTWRFRPRSYLEISSDLGISTAMVAMNSPETILVTFELGRERNLGWPQFQPTRVAQALTRCGCRQPLTAVWGDSRWSVPRYFSRSDIGSSRLSQTPQKEFDLIFVDGSLGIHGIYQDLKNVFGRCAVGGMVIFRGMDRNEPHLPGQYCPRLHGLWERLALRFPGYRYWKAPSGIEVGLALRSF
jgi:hypothetical protein